MAKKKKGMSPTQKVEVAVGITAAAVAAAGTYFLYGSKNANKNRQKVKSWALKAKAEVLNTLEEAKHMSKEEYEQLIEQVAAAYQSAKNNASRADISAFKKEMKEHWEHIEKAGQKVAKQASQAVQKNAKKTAKKTTKKAAKKTTKKSAKKGTKKTTKKTAKKAAKKTAKKAS